MGDMHIAGQKLLYAILASAIHSTIYEEKYIIVLAVVVLLPPPIIFSFANKDTLIEKHKNHSGFKETYFIFIIIQRPRLEFVIECRY